MAFRRDVRYLADRVPALADLTAPEHRHVRRLVDVTEPVLTRPALDTPPADRELT
jgi:hypothetical protein